MEVEEEKVKQFLLFALLRLTSGVAMHAHLAHGTNVCFRGQHVVLWADACGGILVKLKWEGGRGGRGDGLRMKRLV